MKTYYLYIILTRPKTVISKLIHLSKNDEYTHAAISLDKELNFMYSFGRKYTYNPLIGRFKQETIDNGAYKFNKVLPGQIMEIEVSKQQYDKVKSLLEHFINQSYLYKYNYMGLLYGLFNKEKYVSDRFLCSEFVYYILNESGIIDFKVSRNLVRPQSLEILNSRIIYKGDLKSADFISRDSNIKRLAFIKKINFIKRS